MRTFHAGNRDALFMGLMALAMAVWGGSWVCAKALGNGIHYQKLAFVRFALTVLFFIPPIIALRESLRIRPATAGLILLGSVLYTLYSQMFFLGLSLGTAGLGGVLVTSLVPIITYAGVSVLGRKKLRVIDAAGLAIGCAGALVILQIWRFSHEALLASGNLFFVIGAALWSGVTVNSQRTQSSVSIWVYSFYLNGFAALIQFLFVLPYGLDGLVSAEPSWWFSMTYLSLFSTVGATSLYFYAAKKIGSRRASAFTFMVPLTAVLLSWVVLGEVPAVSTIAGGLLSIGAVYLIQFGGAAETPGA
ncbi:MAG TPA: DMT family transporter [Spirochaetota bacterium]|nr:DMT family transporter [Spirochaetota bacterium]HNT09533.1 DMT family transporter [Spirochaetota bacterium]HOS39243.1 DMT family transporter [Spirochaetota bacterium]